MIMMILMMLRIIRSDLFREWRSSQPPSPGSVSTTSPRRKQFQHQLDDDDEVDDDDDDGDEDEDGFVESKQPGDIHLHNPGLVQQHRERGSTF